MSFIREPNAEPLPGYRLIEPLGNGGFGEVWKCVAPGGLYKAIKFVYGNMNSLDMEGARAEQEHKALQRVKEVRHPFVISTERIEIVEGELVIVMELADKSLHDSYVECQAAGLVGIPRDSLLRYIRDAAEALDHMNEKHNLQHLDIKPRNLFLVSERVKVADFGLVKHLERNSASGIMGGVTPLYASPETFSGQISAHSDQYSLAVVYQELLTGQRPFAGKNIRQLAQQHLHEEPELRHLPEAERPVVARALAKDPGKRFPNCLAFVRALYGARMPARANIRSEHEIDLAANGDGKRPATLHETMEDIHLEQMQPESKKALSEDELQEYVEVSELGITVAQPQTGALRPTVIIGVGSFGRRALLELRCRFLDRFGDLSKVPLLRFLYIDTDGDSVKTAVKGAPEVALSPGEVYHVGLQPVSHYRRKQLDHLSDWLPREKLYALPRSLKTQGSRALGRLAFADHHLRLLTRLRREIQRATHPDAIYQSVNSTGLALRDNTPRVYVLAAAGGGNSGLLVDLGYAVRRLLHQMRHPEAPVNAMLLCGAPDDPATSKVEQANVYATLTELNHFADPAVPFAAQYGPDSPRIADNGQPFDCAYLLSLTHRTPECLRDVVAHLGSYLFHEVTTPLGLRLDRSRQLSAGNGATPFRSFGTYAVWFPRGLMLRLAARQACKRIMEDWHMAGEPMDSGEVDAACARAIADPALRPESLATQIEESASQALNATPAEALTKLLATVEEQSQQSLAHDDPGNWARQALSRVRDWLGSGPGSSHEGHEWRKSKLNKSLGDATAHVAEAVDKRLSAAAYGLMESPGRRVAAAEAAFNRFIRYAEENAAAHQGQLEPQMTRTQQAWDQLQKALVACVSGSGGFGFFGGSRTTRSLRVFVDHLAAFARQCLAEDIAGGVQQVFVKLHGRLAERLRDLAFCRQRLRHLQEALDAPEIDPDDTAALYQGGEYTPSFSPIPTTESFWESIRDSATASVVLPQGETELEKAAQRFLNGLNAEQWTHLDQALQEQVLTPRGGLHPICMSTSDLMRSLVAPLTEQAATCLGEHLPVTDVAQVEFSAAIAAKANVPEQVKKYYASASPLTGNMEKANEHCFLLVPASDAGKAYGSEAQQAIAKLDLVRVPGQADLMFCREMDYLNPAELQSVLRPCRGAYEESATVPQASPHARFDIGDWIPLDA